MTAIRAKKAKAEAAPVAKTKKFNAQSKSVTLKPRVSEKTYALSEERNTYDFEGITTKKPLKSLIIIKKGSVGRNNQGRITTRHRSAGARKYYRKVSFTLPEGTSAKVEHIEYDPNRSARLARIIDEKGNYHY